MSVMEALTKLVVGMSRLGDHLLSRKVSGGIVAALAFACGAGLADALKREARTPCAAVAPAQAAGRARAEVGVRDTRAGEAEEEDAVFGGVRSENNVYAYSVEIPAGKVGRCPKR